MSTELSSPPPLSWKQRLSNRLFPSKHLDSPTANYKCRDLLVCRTVIALSFTDRIKLLFTGKAMLETKTATEQLLGRNATVSVSVPSYKNGTETEHSPIEPVYRKYVGSMTGDKVATGSIDEKAFEGGRSEIDNEHWRGLVDNESDVADEQVAGSAVRLIAALRRVSAIEVWIRNNDPDFKTDAWVGATTERECSLHVLNLVARMRIDFQYADLGRDFGLIKEKSPDLFRPIDDKPLEAQLAVLEGLVDLFDRLKRQQRQTA